MRTKVLVVAHSLPFYHMPCWSLLGSHPGIDLTVAHGTGYFTGPNRVPEGKYDESMPFRVVKGTLVSNIFGQSVLWHSKAICLVKQEHFDVVIHQFEIKFLSLWRTHAIVKRKGGKFIAWGIGQSLKPTPVLDVIRRVVATRADALVFYADINKQRFIRMGLDPQRMFIAHNSIDLQPIDDVVAKWSAERINAFKWEHKMAHGPILLHVGRLMARKRLDLLIEATVLLKQKYPNITIILIGDGPEEGSLREMVRVNSLEDNVRFLGTISGEESLAPWFLSSDLVVAPSQVGHLATHAHAYRRVLVTCDNKMLQGPEIGILVPEGTGVLYRDENVGDLARVIEGLLDDPAKRTQMGAEAVKRAHEYCGIPRMVNGFVEAISYVTATCLQKFT